MDPVINRKLSHLKNVFLIEISRRTMPKIFRNVQKLSQISLGDINIPAII